MIEKVHLLWFEQERENDDDTELLIGVYRSEQSVQNAIERLKNQPGFRDYPQGFNSYEVVLNKDNWAEGFIRI